MKRKKKIILWVLLSVFLVLLAGGVCGTVYVLNEFDREVDIEMYSPYSISRKTTLFYYDFSDRALRLGEAKEYGESIGSAKNSIVLDISDMPKHLINAFVAVEDKRFFEHCGVDIGRTLSATVNYMFGRNKRYGGSTITQQVVKNITGNTEYSAARKIQEMIYAKDLESKMSKDEILELYLNIINLAHGNYGVGEAAKYYFSKDVGELTLAECATLAAITSSPSNLDPEDNLQKNLKRRDLVLSLMLEQELISEAEYDEAVECETVLDISYEVGKEETNSWYVDMVVEDVIADLIEKYGYSYEKACREVYGGGLKIYIAVDPEIQECLESYYVDDSNFPIHRDGTTAQSAAIVIDAATGDILGVVGRRGEKSGNRLLDLAVKAKHPTGSVIKPLSVYAPALDKNLITYSSVFDDTPVTFIPSSTSPGKLRPWPYNADFNYHGLTNINRAVKLSTNTVAVKVLSRLGVDFSFDFLTNKLCINGLVDGKNGEGDRQSSALALGQMTEGVTLRDVCAGYSIFPSQGYYLPYRSYYEVTDAEGRIILSTEAQPIKAIDEDTACIMTKILQNTANTGTAHNITLKKYIECAAKTGTTQGERDKWTIGYTPYYICGVWYGYETPRELTGLLRNPCVDIWDGIMTDIHQDQIADARSGRDVLKFKMSDNVVQAEYCVDSGKIITEACAHDPRGSRTETGYFKRGTEPHSGCDCHILVPYDTVNGGVGTFDCNYENIEYVSMLKIERSFPIQVYIDDAQYVWRYVRESEIVKDGTSAFFNRLRKEGEYFGISAADYQFNRACSHCGKKEEESNDPLIE